MKRRRVLACSLLLVLGGTNCGPPLPPSSTAPGDWTGRVVPLQFDDLWIRVTQQGSTLQGTACYTSDVHLIFSGAPVTVDYPHLFVRGSNGFVFDGRFQPDGTIAGNYGAGSPSFPMTLTRDTSGSYTAACRVP
jgi:hypothetical protein